MQQVQSRHSPFHIRAADDILPSAPRSQTIEALLILATHARIAHDPIPATIIDRPIPELPHIAPQVRSQQPREFAEMLVLELVHKLAQLGHVAVRQGHGHVPSASGSALGMRALGYTQHCAHLIFCVPDVVFLVVLLAVFVLCAPFWSDPEVRDEEGAEGYVVVVAVVSEDTKYPPGDLNSL